MARQEDPGSPITPASISEGTEPTRGPELDHDAEERAAAEPAAEVPVEPGSITFLVPSPRPRADADAGPLAGVTAPLSPGTRSLGPRP
jgi:hypothetical protein